jgi:hypothetical protein
MRWTTLESTTCATSETRLSALGTAHSASAPTNGDVAIPLPLPYALELTEGIAAALLLAAAAAEFDDDICGVTGESTGTLAAALSVAAPVVVSLPVSAVLLLAPYAAVPAAPVVAVVPAALVAAPAVVVAPVLVVDAPVAVAAVVVEAVPVA